MDNTYNAHHLLVLEGLEAVRKRPGMYIGSTDTRGLMHCLWRSSTTRWTRRSAASAPASRWSCTPDGSAQVVDNGRGIPVDKEPKTGLSGVEVVFTKLHAGGKFGGGSYNATGGLHGVGSSVVNALSARLDVAVDRSPATQHMSFRRGAPGVFDGEGPSASFTARSGLVKGKRVAKTKTGTTIRFWPDRQMFTKDATFVFEEVVTRARQTSFDRAGPGAGDPRPPRLRAGGGELRHDGGIAEYCEFLASDEPVTEIQRLTGSERFTETATTRHRPH